MQPITFRVEAEDFRALWECTKKRQAKQETEMSPRGGWMWLVLLAVVGVLLFLVGDRDFLLNLAALLAPLIAIFLIFFFAVIRPRFSLENRLRENLENMKYREMRLEVSPRGMELHTSSRTTFFQWRAIEWVESTSDHIVFFDGPTSAVVVPKRAFIDEAEFGEFIRLTTEWWDQAPAAEESDTRIQTKNRSPF